MRSPTFTLIVTYRGGRLPLHHIDLYRLEPSAEDRLSLRELMFGEDVCVVEWFEHFGEAVECLGVDLSYAGTHERRIRLLSGSDRYDRLVQAAGEG